MAYTTINKPSEYFNTKLYTGTGSSNAITGVGFQPDLVWVKDRDAANSHNVSDAVRGATKTIFTDATAAEVTDATRLTSFDSDGFSVGTSTSWNTNTNDYVSWNWLANGAGVSNTDGTITSTVSANTTSGFSIVKYIGNAVSGATFGHGLGAVPKMVIIKSLDNGATNWVIYHASLGNTKKLYFDTAAQATTSNWSNTSPTSSVFTISGSEPNASGENFIAYCFAEKKGFSKIGSYTGNGNADGPFIYTGTKPAFVLIKDASNITSWVILDNKRSPFNSADDVIRVNANSAEAVDTAYADTDFLSNGFKLRTSDAWFNTTGETYIYMAFAENPLVGTNGVPATAR